jgi:diaminopimelate epimerase
VDFRFDVAVPTSAGTYTGHFVDTGSPHFVCELDAMDVFDVQKVGREIRFSEAFQPGGCNVNFISRSRNALAIRTYERGVEAETLACGTGSVAAALIAASLYQLPSPIRVNVRSGEQLQVHFQKQENAFVHVVLEGSAHFVFAGTFVYDSESDALVDFTEQPSAVRA